MFDWIHIVCYSTGKYVFLFFMDECMLNNGLGECWKCHRDFVCSEMLICSVLYGVMYVSVLDHDGHALQAALRVEIASLEVFHLIYIGRFLII